MTRLIDLLQQGPVSVNVGIADFAESLRVQNAGVIEIEWRPPVEQDPALQRILDKIL